MIKYIVSIVYPTTSKNSSWSSYNGVDINVVAIDFMDAEKKALIKFSSMYPNLKGKVMSVNTNEGKFLDNITFKNGGTMSSDNKDMLMSQAKELKHHADELMKVLKDAKDIDAWVVAKAERATTDLSDITHYLDGEEGKYEDGGMMSKGGRLDVGRYYKTKDGRQVRYLGDTPDPELGTFMNKADGVFKVRYDEIEGNASVFAEGGKIYVDLFEERDEMPYKVKVIVDKYENEYGEDISYQSLSDMQREVENVGYTFDFGLDSMPYGLRPIGVDITQLRDYDEDDYYADGGMMKKGGKVAEYQSSGTLWTGYENAVYINTKDGKEYVYPTTSQEYEIFTNSSGSVKEMMAKMWLNSPKLKVRKQPTKSEMLFAKHQFEDGGMMARGGATFSDKVKSISKRLNKTKVPLKYRKEYGKYFNKKEATESAQRIVGAMTKKEK